MPRGRLGAHGNTLLTGTCRPVEGEAHVGEDLLAGLVPHGGPTLEKPVPKGLQSYVKGPRLQQFMQSCRPWEGLTLQKFMENSLSWEGPQTGAGVGLLCLSSGTNNR